MKALFCSNCKKYTGFKRNLGIGTIIMIVLTTGLWILLLPFYPKRCVVCGLDIDRIRKNKFAKAFGTVVLVLLGFFFIYIFIKVW